MKRKLLFAALAIGLGLFAASCNKKELTTTGGEVLATFTISTPGTMTKSETAGKGESVDKVKCVTFDDAGAEIAALTQTVPVASKKATYSTRLVKGQAYRVAFFAYNEAAAAYDLTDLKNITLAASQPANAEGRDAFTAFVDISATDTEAPISKEVHLYRPFAQLNIACSASDFAAAAAAGITVAQSKVKISGTGVAFGAFNAYEDKVAGTAIDEVEYSLANIIAGETITVDNVTYNSLSMNYFLVGDKGEKNTATVEFEWAGNSKSGSATWTNVPLQRNYRTNIIGDILTNPAAFNIIVDDPFDGDHNIKSIASASDLAAALVAGGRYVINNNVGDINLSNVQSSEPLELDIQSEVGSIKIGSVAGANPKSVTVVVAKDVPFPSFVRSANNVGLENFTLKGDLATSEPCAGLNFNSDGGAPNPMSLVFEKNVTIENVAFEGSGLNFSNATGDVTDILIKDCTFKNLTTVGISCQVYNEHTTNNFTVEGNTIEYAQNTAGNFNGIYLLGLNGKMTVKGNTVVNAPYHGIFVRGTGEIVVEDNTVTSAAKDGVKAESYDVNAVAAHPVEGTKKLGTLSILGNTINAGENAVRVTNYNASSTSIIEIKGNTVACGSEYGILIKKPANTADGQYPKVTVSGNVKSGTGTDDKWFKVDGFTPAAGSDYSSPWN